MTKWPVSGQVKATRAPGRGCACGVGPGPGPGLGTFSYPSLKHRTARSSRLS